MKYGEQSCNIETDKILVKDTLLSAIYAPLRYMSWKLCKKSFEMEFKSLVTFRWMSEISSNLFPFKASLSHRNRKKSGRLRSGENGGCSICIIPFFARNCLTILVM
ncbi:hypothetical protein TNCV_874271 [Trichonephila clavipes]|nr:hypothetical protein TNCV_874271 [Trichonephila clavipes]